MNKSEFDRFIADKHPKLTKEEAIAKMKKEYHLVVINRNNSKKKSYQVCESIL